MKQGGRDGHDDGRSQQKRACKTLMRAQFDFTESGDKKRSRRQRTNGETGGMHTPSSAASATLDAGSPKP